MRIPDTEPDIYLKQTGEAIAAINTVHVYTLFSGVYSFHFIITNMNLSHG